MVLDGCLLLAFAFLAGSETVSAQTKLNLSEPLKKCRVYGGGSGLSRIIASDNVQNILLTTDNLSLLSLNLNSAGDTENWKSLSGGRLESELIDSENLYFVASYDNEDRQKSYTLNSVSLKTGITNWQVKVFENEKIILNEVEDEKVLYLTTGNNKISAIRKDEGKIIWTKEYSEKIAYVDRNESNAAELYVLLQNSLNRILVRNGETVEDFKLKKTNATQGIMGRGYLLNGYPTGEIIKISVGSNQNGVRWKIKAGGGISGIAVYDDDVLITSLDNFIYLYSVESGRLKWKKRVAGRINIKPQIYGNLVVVLNSGDNSASVIDLRDGKVVNQIQLENETYFTGEPFITGGNLILQTSRGIYFYANSTVVCK